MLENEREVNDRNSKNGRLELERRGCGEEGSGGEERIEKEARVTRDNRVYSI